MAEGEKGGETSGNKPLQQQAAPHPPISSKSSALGFLSYKGFSGYLIMTWYLLLFFVY